MKLNEIIDLSTVHIIPAVSEQQHVFVNKNLRRVIPNFVTQAVESAHTDGHHSLYVVFTTSKQTNAEYEVRMAESQLSKGSIRTQPGESVGYVVGSPERLVENHLKLFPRYEPVENFRVGMAVRADLGEARPDVYVKDNIHAIARSYERFQIPELARRELAFQLQEKLKTLIVE